MRLITAAEQSALPLSFYQDMAEGFRIVKRKFPESERMSGRLFEVTGCIAKSSGE